MATASDDRPDASSSSGVPPATELTLAEVLDGTLLACDMALEQLDRSLDLIGGEDPDATGVIVAAAVDFAEQHRLVHDSILALLSRRAFATGDLRFMAVLLHVIDALERIEDHCVEIAELTPGTRPPAAIGAGSRRALGELGELVRAQASLAREMLRTRNAGLAERFLKGRADVSVRGGRLLKQMVLERGRKGSGAPAVIGLVHCLEDISESASEIAEQTVFLVTGLFREVSENASPSGAAEAFLA